MTDPFDALRTDPERQEPRPSFTRRLRARLVDELGLDDPTDIPTIELPERKHMTTTDPTPDHEIQTEDRAGTGGGIWAGVFYEDALAGIDQLVEVFGFERQIVVTDPDGTAVVHSQLRWPEGGIVQVGTHDPANPFSHPPGGQSLYVVTAAVQSVWDRCQRAGLEVLRPLEEPDYAPGTTMFTVRDREGNIFTFGSYGLDG